MSEEKKMPVNEDSPLTPDQRAEIAKPIEETPPAHHAPSVSGTETEHVHEKPAEAAVPPSVEETEPDVDAKAKEALDKKEPPHAPTSKSSKKGTK